ncbi:MAG: SDR family NAD(P)-dependent oxidoreductase [Terricaulis sp.]
MRFSPVILIAGAASAAGMACAQRLASDATGGLLLVDGDEAMLTATADTLVRPPERVSMLTFDIADAARWQDAANFVRDQYGRLDWAIACISPDQQNAVGPGAAIGLIKAVGPLMKKNMMGGAVSLIVSARAVKVEALLHLVDSAATQGRNDNVRVNAVMNGGIESALWRRDPEFETLVREQGSEAAALTKLSQISPPLARCNAKQDCTRLAQILLGDEASVSGVTLVAGPSDKL